MFWIGLLIGFMLGVVAVLLWAAWGVAEHDKIMGKE